MVVGPRRRGLIHQLGVGSTVDWLLERPDPPVAVIRSSRPTRRVVLHADGTADARRAAVCLASLPWLDSCQVTVVAAARLDLSAELLATDVMPLLFAAGAAPRLRPVDVPRGISTRDLSAAVFKAVNEVQPDILAMGLGSFRGLRGAFRATSPKQSTQTVLVAVAVDERGPRAWPPPTVIV
jgi:hypothetical protein